ncbi:MAG TPA: DUF1990 family protein [Nocardioidaceae bacterium]|nr:DUF1990 family protein [Nocardioidaceae bacterium]
MSRVALPPVGRIDVAAEYAELRTRRVNYSVGEVDQDSWNHDVYRSPLSAERPGPPEPAGVWERACRLVESYQFTTPEIVRAFYDPHAPLLGRDMLLQGRFYGLRFYLGVRVTSIIDETRKDEQRLWGWAYETLEGHLERGRISYEVVKDLRTGTVEFVITAYSQLAPTVDLVTRLGWRAFGRRTQLRFYDACGVRLHDLVTASGPAPTPLLLPAGDGELVLAPADAQRQWLDRLALHRSRPGEIQ